MPLKKEHVSDDTSGLCKLTIDEDMTIYAIDDIKREISKHIDSYDSFEFDLEGVEDIDSAGIQLLLAFRSELERKHKKFKLIAMSSVVAELFQNYGISERFKSGDSA